MKSYLKRADNFEEKREHLKSLSDEELKALFWSLAEKVIDPMLDLAHTHTTPSIERSVLLRMGFSSIEVKDIVDRCIQKGLVAYGAGHVVYKLSKMKNIEVRAAGLLLIEGKHWDELVHEFKG